MTDPELAAAQAYVRLLETTRAVLADARQAPLALPLLTVPIAEADEALRAVGLAGNEATFFRLVARLRTVLPEDRGHDSRAA
ncbi:hypothetical protein ACFO9E_05910 [Streptomyces maoxianensis]|uniref:Uncharacterized protein n=1 Tax=Streptomyces maoxianensis TaxID=1459942 RepID=A0ABV9G1G5_9ACTN